VRACGRTLLYLRWADPIPLRRAWCVFELGTTIKEGAQLKVIMPPADVASFKDALQNDFDSLTLKTCSVDVEKAGAKEADDLRFIRRTIQESMGGFLKINQHVIHEMRKWMANKARKALRALPEEEQGASALIHNLASFLFWGSGRPSEAEPLYRQALAARGQKLGDEHEQTLLSRANLGLCCSWQGKFDEAEALVSDSASAYRRTLGDSHPDTLSAINNMALVLFTRGKLNEAEALHREVLAKRRGLLGDDDLETARSANNLANVLRDSGKLDEAEALYRVALDKRLSSFGDTHEFTVNTIHNLGMVLFARGKLDEAEPLLKQALTTRRRTKGDDHEYTLLSFSNVGSLLSERGDLAGSEALFCESLRGFRDLASTRFEDYRALLPRVGLAACLRRQGRFDEALPLARDAHQLSREVLSEEHLLVLACAHELGVLLRLLGARQQALSYARAAYEGRLRVQGAGSRFTLASQLSLARLQGDGALAASISTRGIKE
jgi:tetratricopeptide (TPR) repeat protein